MPNYALGETFDLARAYAGAEDIKSSQQASTLRGLQIDAARKELAKPEIVSYEEQIGRARLLNGAYGSLIENSSDENFDRQLRLLDESGVRIPNELISQFKALPPEQRLTTLQEGKGAVETFILNAVEQKQKEAKSKFVDTTKPGPYGTVFGQEEVDTGKFDPYANPSQPHKPDKPPSTVASPLDVQRLRKEFRQLPSVKDYETVLPLIKSAEKAPKTPAGDLQLIYSVGKIFDPGSVVREGELQLTQDAMPWLKKMVGQYQKQVKGGAVLDDNVRQDFIDALNERVSAYRSAYQRDYQQYGEYAREGGIDPVMVVGSPAESAYGQPQPDAVASPDAATDVPEGIDPAVWAEMTPEERAAWQ